MKPLVSVIAISYNHGAFIKEALEALFAQTYEAIEVIILDDCSNDNSVEEIQMLIDGREIEFIRHTINQGYTKTFNEGLKKARGKYVIDYSLDDLMLPNFINSSVLSLEDLDESYGLVFSNAEYIDKRSRVIANHNDLLFRKKLLKSIPSGNVFQWVLKRYFICTPTMLMNREMLLKLGGYDEQLAYEDFDLWVRAARYWKFAFLDEVTFQKRKLTSSMSAQRHMHHYNEQMDSVYAVCRKAFHLCKSKEDLNALHERLNYEYRQCVKHGAEHLVDRYLLLLKDAGGSLSMKSRLYRWYKRKFRVMR
jgi:glycosyltransferase involved in cell wall biosynthesis